MVACCTCLNLIGIGSSQTIVAIFNITAPALDLSYVAVIFARMWYADEVAFVDGPFTLGRWGRPVNVVSIVWVLFISVILFLPPVKPVTGTNLNYAICVAGFMAVFALGWWWAGARKWVSCAGLVGRMAIANGDQGLYRAPDERCYGDYSRPRSRDFGIWNLGFRQCQAEGVEMWIGYVCVNDFYDFPLY